VSSRRAGLRATKRAVDDAGGLGVPGVVVVVEVVEPEIADV